jgi:hypothetical protein
VPGTGRSASVHSFLLTQALAVPAGEQLEHVVEFETPERSSLPSRDVREQRGKPVIERGVLDE